MRNLVLALLAVSGLAMVGTAPAEAVGVRYPYCMQGQDAPGLSDCRYTSYEQCQATASGRFLYCIENPYYVGVSNSDDPRAYRGRSRVRPGFPFY
jgi:Protein of unknown function (DUF3551)